MKTILHFYLLFRVILFVICAFIFLPIGIVFKERYVFGVLSGMHRFIDEYESTGILDKDECDELRKDLDG